MKLTLDNKYVRITIAVIIILLLIFIPKKCGRSSSETKIVTTIDTVWVKKTDTITKIVKEVSYKYIKPKGKQYTPGENIDTCKSRFDYLLKQHIKSSVYLDTIKFDSLGVKGFMTVRDTIWLNKFKGKRQYISNFEFPTITKTTTITQEALKRGQLYMGGNLYGDKSKLHLITPGILYKTKKDVIYQMNAGIAFDGNIVYGAGVYYKLTLRKKK